MFELRTDLFAEVCPRRRRGNVADVRKSLCKKTTLQRIRDFKGKATKGEGEAGGTARELVQVSRGHLHGLGPPSRELGFGKESFKDYFCFA